MIRLKYKSSAFSFCAAVAVFATAALAENFNIPGGDLKAALDAYAKQSGIELMYSASALGNTYTRGAKGNLSPDAALSNILNGTGFIPRHESNAIAIVRSSPQADALPQTHIAAVTVPSTPGATLETVTVTSSKIGGDVQNIPISITALSQEQLTATQTTGGPDLVKQVPNLTFSKTNFTGYNIQIRGIGTQAISVTTDPAVAVAFNDVPFIRNHFFEQEFYDVSQLEVLRGPQGTLYGRNATAGVVNVVSAKGSIRSIRGNGVGGHRQLRKPPLRRHGQSADGRRSSPDLRVAGEWTKRQGYTFNESTDQRVDGRDLWSGRVTLGFKPTDKIQSYLVWEHFSEDDDRVRSSKQLCKKDPGLSSIDGMPLNTTTVPLNSYEAGFGYAPDFNLDFVRTWLSQGCLPASFYSKDAFETPNGQTIPFVAAGEFVFNGASRDGTIPGDYLLKAIDPYASQTQSQNLRVIQSLINPQYRAKNDTLEFNVDYTMTPELTLTSQTGYNKDFLYSTEDFNRFNTQPGIFDPTLRAITDPQTTAIAPGGVYCDPQLGCSSSMVAEDLSRERAWQFSEEMRLASHFDGPLNFSAGGNYMHYETVEDYFVFFNVLSAEEQLSDGQSPGQFTECIMGYPGFPVQILPISTAPFLVQTPTGPAALTANFSCGAGDTIAGRIPYTYIDPHPLNQIDGLGHNYFRSENPYRLNSVAGFGEAYYQVLPDVKLTAGLRWTDDSKTFFNIPSWTYLLGGSYPIEGIVRQEWKEWTGRFVANWTPKLDFTDQTLVYASYSRGYKGGGANPPGPELDFVSSESSLTHPATFRTRIRQRLRTGREEYLARRRPDTEWRCFLL